MACRNGTIRAHLTRKAKAQASLENVRDSFQNTATAQEEPIPTPAPVTGEKQTKEGYQIADVLYLRCRYKFLLFVSFRQELRLILFGT
jgi:hypothetical protein